MNVGRNSGRQPWNWADFTGVCDYRSYVSRLIVSLEHPTVEETQVLSWVSICLSVASINLERSLEKAKTRTEMQPRGQHALSEGLLGKQDSAE